MPKSLHATVSGVVQGVYFRAWTREQAQKLGLTGWVRNKTDGTVEVLAQGDDESLKAMEQKLNQGSPASKVDTVNKEYREVDESLDSFQIRY